MYTDKPQYAEGYAVALIPPPEQPRNPYPSGSEEYLAWEEGYGDATDDYIRWQGGEFDADQA